MVSQTCRRVHQRATELSVASTSIWQCKEYVEVASNRLIKVETEPEELASQSENTWEANWFMIMQQVPGENVGKMGEKMDQNSCRIDEKWNKMLVE